MVHGEQAVAKLKKYTYDFKKYDFARTVKELFDCSDLQKIHEQLPPHIQYNELHQLGEDNKTWFHKKFYAPINEGNSPFQSLYERFIAEEVSTHCGYETFLYQKSPTFRVQAPNNIAVGGWHRDRDYNHSPHEINMFLPLTPAYGTNTIWTESIEGLGDYTPLEAEVGEYYVWDGVNLNHGNKVNTTNKSRVSIDFRILPHDKYDPDTEMFSVSRGKKFILGDYYSLYEAKK